MKSHCKAGSGSIRLLPRNRRRRVRFDRVRVLVVSVACPCGFPPKLGSSLRKASTLLRPGVLVSASDISEAIVPRGVPRRTSPTARVRANEAMSRSYLKRHRFPKGESRAATRIGEKKVGVGSAARRLSREAGQAARRAPQPSSITRLLLSAVRAGDTDLIRSQLAAPRPPSRNERRSCSQRSTAAIESAT